jgi:hypothetical protein
MRFPEKKTVENRHRVAFEIVWTRSACRQHVDSSGIPQLQPSIRATISFNGILFLPAGDTPQVQVM